MHVLINCVASQLIFMLKFRMKLFIFALLIVETLSYQCPCKSSDNLPNVNIANSTICIKQNEEERNLFVSLDSAELENIVVMGSNKTMADTACSVIIHVSNESIQFNRRNYRLVCPGDCRPVPLVTVPLYLLLNGTKYMDKDTAITCSMNVDMLSKSISSTRNHAKLLSSGSSNNDQIVRMLSTIRAIGIRRLLECHEKHSHQLMEDIVHSSPTVTDSRKHLLSALKSQLSAPKRRVRSVVMWMGTASNIQLIRQQAAVLDAYPDQGDTSDNIVISWAATDDLYSCAEEHTKCLTGVKQYNGFLPKSDVNFMAVGWRCAQRRPLRSLAHVLSLYSPGFVVLLDDDTFLNYALLMRRYGSFLMNDMYRQPIYLGEFQGREGDKGHLSTKGFFAGGSGYIIGHNLLSRLQQKTVSFFGFEDRTQYGISANSSALSAQQLTAMINRSDFFRTPEHHLHLSVLVEGLEHAHHACKLVSSCVTSMVPRHPHAKHTTASHKKHSRSTEYTKDNSLVVPIAVRLVDFCSNLMAADNTCQHSDHSLGRCMLYGAGATPVGLACHSTAPLDTLPMDDNPQVTFPPAVKDVKIGLCFMTSSCNTSEQITCHRYRATPKTQQSDGTISQVPERNSHKKGYYRLHSSVFNGTFTDTFG